MSETVAQTLLRLSLLLPEGDSYREILDLLAQKLARKTGPSIEDLEGLLRDIAVDRERVVGAIPHRLEMHVDHATNPHEKRVLAAVAVWARCGHSKALNTVEEVKQAIALDRKLIAVAREAGERYKSADAPKPSSDLS